ncbi:MAG: AlpA family phage regulatory protein [Burkholderiales bacterium]|nr:AlpA family phage regulatory protein [Burkholderiales bacterium]
MQPLYYRLADITSTGRRKGPKRQGLLPISPAELWRMVSAREFPSPVKLGPRLTAWRAADVKAWADAKAAEAK